MDNSTLRRQLDERRITLRRDRLSYWQHWCELATYILPRRYKWLVTPNQTTRGSPVNQQILDSTGTLAARDCAAGMIAGTCNPARPWFKVALMNMDLEESSPGTRWLAECERRMRMVLQDSNFYTTIGQLFFDLVVFGSAAMTIYEDYEDVIRCYGPCLGEFYAFTDARGRCAGLYREFNYTIKQCVDEFGLENCSPQVRSTYNASPSNWATEILLAHAIEKPDATWGLPADRPWAEAYWEVGSANQYLLRKRGFHEQPVMLTRWDIVGNDSYGRGPGMDALPDIKELQHHTKRKAQAIDKMVTPPMLADITMKNQPASLLPGGITFVAGLASGKAGFQPAYTVQPPVQELREDIAAIQDRVRRTFYNNLFMTVTNLDTVRSATEIDARRAEQLVMLGPVLERFENEALSPIIERVFGIMNRAGLFPPAPEEIQGRPIKINFISMLQESQRTASAAGIERWMATLGNMAAVNPDVLDKMDSDQIADTYGSFLSVPPKLIRDDDTVAALRSAREKARQQQQMDEQALPAVKAAQTLSNTQVGGAGSALDLMMSAGGGGAG